MSIVQSKVKHTMAIISVYGCLDDDAWIDRFVCVPYNEQIGRSIFKQN